MTAHHDQILANIFWRPLIAWMAYNPTQRPEKYPFQGLGAIHRVDSLSSYSSPCGRGVIQVVDIGIRRFSRVFDVTGRWAAYAIVSAIDTAMSRFGVRARWRHSEHVFQGKKWQPFPRRRRHLVC